jgi:hypothetical protein
VAQQCDKALCRDIGRSDRIAALDATHGCLPHRRRPIVEPPGQRHEQEWTVDRAVEFVQGRLAQAPVAMKQEQVFQAWHPLQLRRFVAMAKRKPLPQRGVWPPPVQAGGMDDV